MTQGSTPELHTQASFGLDPGPARLGTGGAIGDGMNATIDPLYLALVARLERELTAACFDNRVPSGLLDAELDIALDTAARLAPRLDRRNHNRGACNLPLRACDRRVLDLGATVQG